MVVWENAFLLQKWSFCNNQMILSLKHVLWTNLALLVKIRSMLLEILGSLKHIGCLLRLCKPQELWKLFILSSSAHASKLPGSNMFSYLAVNVSNALLIILRSFLLLFLCGLCEELLSQFSLWRVISVKKLSPVAKSWLRSLDISTLHNL